MNGDQLEFFIFKQEIEIQNESVTHKINELFESLSTNGNAGYIARMAQLSAHLKNASNFSFLSEIMYGCNFHSNRELKFLLQLFINKANLLEQSTRMLAMSIITHLSKNDRRMTKPR